MTQSPTSIRAWQITRLIAPPPVRHLLHVLNLHADAKGYCWPSIATLVRETGLGRRTIQRTIAHLEEAKWLDRGIRRRQHKRYDTTLYRLTLPTRGATVTLPPRQGGAENVPENVEREPRQSPFTTKQPYQRADESTRALFQVLDGNPNVLKFPNTKLP